jgi:PAS domain S-box-containing protein
MEKRLLRGEEKYRDLIENINEVLYAVDENGIVTYISGRVRDIAGFEPVEIIGNNVFSFIHEDDRAMIEELLHNNSRGYIEQADFRARSKSGEVLWVRANSRPLIVRDVFMGIKGSMTDVTAVKEAERQLQEKNWEIESTWQALEHEKNLMALIMEKTPAAIVMVNRGGIETSATTAPS